MRPAVAAVVFGCLLLTLAATSTPRVIGDGAEYVHLSARMASLRLPGAGESRHFVFYSALAAPLVVLLGEVGLDPLAAFTVLNGLLLLAGFYVAASRLHWTWCVLIFASPILWWVDKPHTEPFTFALFAIAFALLESAPWWSLVAAGASATQNPGNAVLMVILAAAAISRDTGRLKDGHFWAGLVSGGVLAALHPVYYLMKVGALTRLAGSGDIHWITRSEYLAVLTDPNVGLLPHAPVYAAAVLGAVVVLLLRAPTRLAAAGVLGAVASGAWLAFVAATATNVNHGGTPGLSRYATWFIPLAIPLFQEVDRVFPRRLGWMAGPALVSAVLGVWTFHPARAEAADRPTRLASFLWTRYPSADNPLPEIFAERLRGLDENWLPVSTPGCEKILLPGRGGRDSVWPMPCVPATPPARCQAAGALCYANRTGTGYSFVSARVSTPQAFRLDRSATWPASAEPVVADLLASLAWWNMRVREEGSPDAIIRSSRHVSQVYEWQAANRLFVFAVNVRPGAQLTAQVTQDMNGRFTVEGGASDGAPGRLQPGRGAQVITLPSPHPWVIFVAEAR